MAGEGLLGVGIDLVEVEEVERTLHSVHAERYLERVYTSGEIRDCTGPAGLDAARLAARFAAKEAALKALRGGDRPLPWNHVEVRRQADGAPELALSGAAAALAREAGVGHLAVSLTHERAYASAVVLALS